MKSFACLVTLIYYIGLYSRMGKMNYLKIICFDVPKYKYAYFLILKLVYYEL